MACNKAFSGHYILLAAEEVTVLDLIRVLVSRKIEERKFVDCPKGLEVDFQYRWLIFVSGLALMLLRIMSRPMAWLGSLVELWLNILPTNGGVGGLMRNLLGGKVVIPNRESANFVSSIGNVDKRVELDRSIKPGDKKYNAALSLMASKISYENGALIHSIVTNQWKMEFLGFYDFWNDYQDKCTTQAFLLRDTTTNPEKIIISFRGTEPFDADSWASDADMSFYELPGIGKVHGGFMKALGLQKSKGWPKQIEENHAHPPPAYYAIREMLREQLKETEGAKFIVTGHSLGGALAILFPAVLAMHEEEWLLERLEGVYTFGQPRVGDAKFGEFMSEKLREYSVAYFRFVYNNDMVPRLPYDDGALLFKHFGPCLFFNSLYKGKVTKEEPNKNYFSIRAGIPMFISAVWEIIRSFITQDIWGPSFKEGWFLRTMRLSGLLVPGLPDHAPQDYDNLTRVGFFET